MTKAACRRWLKTHAKDLRRKVGAGDWRVAYILSDGLSGGEAAATDVSSYAYKKTSIWLDFNRIQSEEHLADVVRHELLHLHGAHYEQIGEMARSLTKSCAAHKFLNRALFDAHEGLVERLETMLDLGCKRRRHW
jgi:hypothetical protein